MYSLRDFEEYINKNAKGVNYLTVSGWIEMFKKSIKQLNGEVSSVGKHEQREKVCPYCNSILWVDDLNVCECLYCGNTF